MGCENVWIRIYSLSINSTLFISAGKLCCRREGNTEKLINVCKLVAAEINSSVHVHRKLWSGSKFNVGFSLLLPVFYTRCPKWSLLYPFTLFGCFSVFLFAVFRHWYSTVSLPLSCCRIGLLRFLSSLWTLLFIHDGNFSNDTFLLIFVVLLTVRLKPVCIGSPYSIFFCQTGLDYKTVEWFQSVRSKQTIVIPKLHWFTFKDLRGFWKDCKEKSTPMTFKITHQFKVLLQLKLVKKNE